MPVFEKRPGAPAGAFLINVAQGSFTFTDGGTVSTNDIYAAKELAIHPWTRQVGGSEVSVPYRGRTLVSALEDNDPDVGDVLTRTLDGFEFQAPTIGGTVADGAITTNKIAANAVTAAKVASDVATQAELDAVAAAKANTSHQHAATDITSGTMPTARLGSGTANSGTILYGDNTWKTAPTGGSGGATTASQVSVTPSGTMSSTDVQSALQEAFTELAGGAGASTAAQVSVTPSGTMSSTNVQAALQEAFTELAGAAGAMPWINVMEDFAATGNGTTDDFAVLQQAANAASNGKMLYFPPGRYAISRPLVLGLKRTGYTASTQSHMDEPAVLFAPGAVVEPHSSFTTSVTTPDEKPLLLVMASDMRLINPRVEGTGSKGSGVGIRFGGGRNWRGADNQTTTLTAAITAAGQTSISFSGTNFPDADGFFIEIGGERMFVVSGAGTNTFTVTRGEAGGVAAATHASGATVTLLGFQTVYRSTAANVSVTRCATGVEFGIKENSTSSTGDCQIFGGYVTNCKRGFLYKGFVNHTWGTTVASCDVGHDVSERRNSSKAGIHGATVNNCSNAAIWVRGGEGTVIDGDMWSENADSTTTACTIRVGQTSGTDEATASSTAYNTHVVGSAKIHPDLLVRQDELIHLVRAVGFQADGLTLSTNSDFAPSAFVRVDSTVPAHAGNRIKKITAWPGSGGKNRMSDGALEALPTPVVYAAPSTENQLVVESHYETALTSNVGTVIGGFNVIVAPATYTLYKTTANGATTYFAKNRFGSIRAFASDTATVSGLKAILDALKATGVSFHFTDGTFSFLDDVAGQFNATFNSLHGLKFTGEGPQATILRSLSNATTGSDNEPLSFSKCNDGYMANLACRTEGTPRDSSDGWDLDAGTDWLVENVWVTAARGNGFHVDGKDDPAFPCQRIRFVNCLAMNCQNDGWEFLATENCEAISCTARNNLGHGFQVTKASTSAAQPNMKSVGNLMLDCVSDTNGRDGFNINSSDYNRIVNGIARNNSNVQASKDGGRVETSNSISANRNFINLTAYDTRATKIQRYGVNIQPAVATEANDNFVAGNLSPDNLTGAYSDTGTRTVKNGHVTMTEAAYGGITPDPTLLYVLT